MKWIDSFKNLSFFQTDFTLQLQSKWALLIRTPLGTSLVTPNPDANYGNNVAFIVTLTHLVTFLN